MKNGIILWVTSEWQMHWLCHCYISCSNGTHHLLHLFLKVLFRWSCPTWSNSRKGPLTSNRQHLSSGACLEDKREDNQNCSVLCCVRQLCTMICTHVWAVLTLLHVRLRFLFVCLFRFCRSVFFDVSLGHFVLVLLAFVVLAVGFSFFSTEPRDWQGRTSLKWPILCRVGRKTFTKSVSPEKAC